MPSSVAEAPAVTERALLFTDVVDSTQRVEQLGDAAAVQLWTEHDRRARDLLARHHGREIDRTDGFFLLFDAPLDALRYALDYHAALAGLSLRARVWLHVGAVTLRENLAEHVARGAKPLEVEGLAKPFAARVMALAAGGQTLLSAAARAALGDTLPDGTRAKATGTIASRAWRSRSRSSRSVCTIVAASRRRPTPTRPTASCSLRTIGRRCARSATTCPPSLTPSSAAARSCVRWRSGSMPVRGCAPCSAPAARARRAWCAATD